MARGPSDEGNEVRQRIVAFIASYIREHGFSPTDAEIAEHVGRTRQAVSQQVLLLAEQGRLVLHGKRRVITVPPTPTEGEQQ